jgi:hypothetical protein
MAFNIEQIIIQLKDIGVYDYILPFLLVFTILFAILEKIKIFGTDKKNVNVVVSIIIGFLLIVQTPLVYIMNNFLGKISLFIIVVIMFLLVTGIFGVDAEGGFTGTSGMIAIIICILAIFWALSPGLFDLPSWLNPSSSDIAVIILIVVIIATIAFIVGGKKQESVIERMGKEMFKKGP